jgi:hypothetical protein
MFGILGCILCITGSLAIVLHAPAEKPIESVQQVWSLAMQPGEQRCRTMLGPRHVVYESVAYISCSCCEGVTQSTTQRRQQTERQCQHSCVCGAGAAAVARH